MTVTTLVVVPLRTGGLLVDQFGTLVTESVATLRALRIVLLRVAEAMEDGLLEDLVAGLRALSEAVELIDTVSGQIDRALPVLDATAPTLGLMNGTLAQLNTTLTQIDAIPGVRMARKLVTRPTLS